jgi:hypothetical protein
MNIQKTLAMAALSGLMAGSLVACSGDAKPEAAPAAEAPAAEAPAAAAPAAAPEAMAEAEQPATIPEHGCKGMNECKGQGGCHVEGANSCTGGNECKGKGGCCTMKEKSDCPADE